jgi:hypothetical protein
MLAKQLLKMSIILIYFTMAGCLDNIEEKKIPIDLSIGTSMTLYGQVVDAATKEQVHDVTLHIKVGPTWREATTFTDGAFKVTDVPPASNYEIVLSSETGMFMDRVVYGTSTDTLANNTYTDLGNIEVSAPKQYQFTVIDADSNEHLPGFIFKAYSQLGCSVSYSDYGSYYTCGDGVGSTYETYAHVSSYDPSTGVYSMSLPADLEHLKVTVSLDVNSDGHNDYKPAYSNDYWSSMLYFEVSTLPDSMQIDLVGIRDNGTDYEEFELKISVLDETLEAITEAPLIINDNLNSTLNPVYDIDNKQYVFDAKISSSPLEIRMPAFVTSEQIRYGSACVYISAESENNYYVNITGTENSKSYHTDMQDSVMNIVMVLSEQPETSQLEVVTKSQNVSGTNHSAKIFYSAPVELQENSVALFQNDVVSITRGNESSEDLVLPGVTLITFNDVKVDANATMSLGNTLMTLNTNLSLTAGYSYTYNVAELIDIQSGLSVDISDDDVSFYISSSAAFDIEAIKLDNHNYWTNGSRITATNTAGQAATNSEHNNPVHMVLPLSLENLESLYISKYLVTSDGVEASDIATWKIVENGVIQTSYGSHIDKVYWVERAYNEIMDVEYNSYYNRPIQLAYGSTQPEGLGYRMSVQEYMMDNTPTSVNSISFEYAYETQDGAVQTGDITLPVQ